jgi:hypothetical protein
MVENKTMTEEDMRKGYWYSGEPTVKFDPTSLSGREAMMNAAPKPSLETRLGWLEADASAQRTAILRLEWRIYVVAIAVALVGLAALVFSIALEVRT